MEAIGIWDQRDIYWIAGILEGEGSFHNAISRGIPYPTVSVEMKDKDIIERLANVTGIGVVRESTRPSRPEHWSKMFTWRVSKGQDVARLLLAVYPEMGERRQAQIAELVNNLTATKRTRSDKGKRRNVRG